MNSIKSDSVPRGVIWFLMPAVIVLSQSAAAISTVRMASGLSRPVYVTAPASDIERIFIVEQHTGQIKILDLGSGTINASPFLTIAGVSTRNEQGLLGLAFSPDYGTDGKFYVNYTSGATGGGDTYIVEYQVSADPNIADPGSASVVMTYSQPYRNHNGGWLGFGPDGYLYIAAGDGGNGDDPGNRAQDITNQRLGKLLRIDVTSDAFPADTTRNYAIPLDNPFVAITGDDEIWAYGLRNPWRSSFDRLTGDLYIADVGQGDVEEINFQPAASTGGENYGWRVMEGTMCNFPTDPLPCYHASFTTPIHEYSHAPAPDGGYSITGGYVYRGPVAPLHGVYFFADYVSNQIWSLSYDGFTKTGFTNRTAELVPDVGAITGVSSFGEDAVGNLYIVDLGGEVFKIICDPPVDGDYDSDCDADMGDLGVLSDNWDDTMGFSELDDLATNWLEGRL